MRVPQVTERIKEAPVQALRGVLSGIGQVLLFTDKLRNKNATPADAPDAAATDSASDAAAPAADSAEAAPAAEASVAAEAEAVLASTPAEAEPVAEPVAEAEAEAAPAAKAAAPAKTRKPRKPRDLNKTGNVRIITEDDAAPAPAEVEVVVAEVVVAEVPAEAEVSADAEAPAGSAPTGELPMPTYDDLSVASIRARMRNLTAAQIATLADYERAHAARPEVVTMFERRIAKLEAEG
jgi:hypothetical protein